MTLYHNKIKFHVDAEFADSATILELFKERYPLIPYCGFYQLHNQVWLYVHHTKKLSAKQLHRGLLQLRPETKIKGVFKYSTILGTLINESGTRPVQGRPDMSSSSTNNGDGTHASSNHSTAGRKRVVKVNPFAQESLEHITLTYTREMLAQDLGWGVLCEFANELYRVEENMNIRVRIKERYLKTKTSDGLWWTSLKETEYETILRNIVQKYRVVVDTFKERIPADRLAHYEKIVNTIEHMRIHEKDTEERDAYERFGKDAVNIVGENIFEVAKYNKLKLV